MTGLHKDSLIVTNEGNYVNFYFEHNNCIECRKIKVKVFFRPGRDAGQVGPRCICSEFGVVNESTKCYNVMTITTRQDKEEELKL